MMLKIKRHKTPTIIQMEALECGAAAVAIILAYYGCYVPLEKMRVECGVSRGGSKAINMLKAARKYGMTAQGVKIEDIIGFNEITLPAIVFWKFNHFIVVEGIKKNKIYVNDPETGPRVMNISEFDRGFTGVVLDIVPGPEFKKTGKPPSLIQSLLPWFTRIKESALFIVLTSLALVIPGILIPGFSKIFIDNILIQQAPDWILPLLVGMGITALMRGLFHYLQQHYLLRLEIKFALVASHQFIWHLLHLPMLFFYQRFAGDINERIRANDRITELLSGDLNTAIVSLLSVVFFAVVLILLDFPLALIGISIALINSYLLYFMSQHIANASRNFLQEYGKLAGIGMNGLQMIETIKATSSENYFFKKWAGQHVKTINTQQKIELYSQTLVILSQLLNGLLTVTILGYGGFQIMQGQLTIGTLVAFQSLMVSFNAPLFSLLSFGSTLQRIRGDVARVEDVLNYPIDKLTTLSNRSKKVKKLKGNIELRDLSFSYSPMDSLLFEHLALSIPAGARIAIAGKSAAGKSTLAKLICSLFAATEGEILFDDTPALSINRETMASSIAYVDQDIFLFEGSVKDNLTLWDSSIPIGHIENALKDAHIEQEINARGGLTCQISENGLNFSGGQRQRLEIARALVYNPSILILDEATSQLDSLMEQKIYASLKQRDCTLVIISHRLSAIRDCDEILVLDNGTIVERGTHQQLLQRNGIYQELMQYE